MRAGRPRSQAKADAEGGRRPGAGDRYFFIINIDAQDAQDEQDESLLHEKPAPAMIACGFADAQDYKLAVS